MFAKAYIEITGFCGLNCDFCKPKKTRFAPMNLDLFEKINKELKNKTKTVAYHILGDPLTVPNLQDYIDISAKYGLGVHITTSGYYMDNIDEKTLFHPSVKQINFSISSFYANKNTKIPLDEYLHKIIIFCKKSSETPKRFVNLRLWNIGDSRYSAFNEDVFFILKSYFEEDFLFDTNEVRIAPYTIVVKDKIFTWPDINKEGLHQKGTCHAITGQIGFLANGDVVPCCLDAKADIKLGNIKECSLDAILSSKRAIAMKQGFNSSILVEKLCQTCGFRDTRL